VCVCVSVRQDVSRTTRVIFTKFFMHVVYGRGSVVLQQGDVIPRGRGNFGGFPIESALYSIAFGTHTKTAESIEMLFGMIGGLGQRNNVLRGGDDL